MPGGVRVACSHHASTLPPCMCYFHPCTPLAWTAQAMDVLEAIPTLIDEDLELESLFAGETFHFIVRGETALFAGRDRTPRHSQPLVHHAAFRRSRSTSFRGTRVRLIFGRRRVFWIIILDIFGDDTTTTSIGAPSVDIYGFPWVTSVGVVSRVSAPSRLLPIYRLKL